MSQTSSLFRRAIVSECRLNRRRAGWPLCFGVALCAYAAIATAQASNVSVHLDLDPATRHSPAAQGAVWLVPQSHAPQASDKKTPGQQAHSYQLLQKGKEFHPHFLVVPVGSSIDFPNEDPFFHNVFSLFEGKRFDLGLYEAGSRRTVQFDREGVSYIFCNIHPEMGAVIISLRTPYYAVLGPDRTAVIENVPDGEYLLKVWCEDATPESIHAAEQKVAVKPGKPQLYTLNLTARAEGSDAHKNKFGEDYPPQHAPTY